MKLSISLFIAFLMNIVVFVDIYGIGGGSGYGEVKQIQIQL